MRENHKGMTLIEVIVAMVMVSMVVLIASMALKLSIKAWERAAKEGEYTQALISLPLILDKQFKSIIIKNPLKYIEKSVLPFCGNEDSMSFFTSYAPQGSPYQGLLRVSYVYNKDKSKLYLYEQIITTKEDLEDNNNPISDKWENQTEPVSQIEKIQGVIFGYSDQKEIEFDNEEHFKDTWKCDTDSAPIYVKVGLYFNKEKDFSDVEESSEDYKFWFFKIGVTGL